MDEAAGIYSRIIFPDALSKIDPRLSELQKAMLAATPDCIKVVSTDGKLLTMNRAGCHALGVPEDSEFGMPWLPLLPEEVHPLGIKALGDATAGRNARFPGRSLSPEGIRYWDNLLTPLVDVSGQVLSILCVSRDITAKILLEKQLEEAIAREKLISREMQHRIKNLFSVVSGLIVIAEKEAGSANAPGTTTKLLREKLGALSRASDAVFAQDDDEICDASPTDLTAIVRSVLQPYGERCNTVGSPTSIPRNTMTTFALFLHELATNSVKYGAFSAKDGNVTVQWAMKGEMLNLTWIETGGPPISSSPERRGFGSEMVDRFVQSAGGTINRTWRSEGLVADLYFPHYKRG